MSVGSGGERWRTPAGISAIAAAGAVLVALIALFVNGASDEPSPAANGSPSPTPTATHEYMFVYGSSMPRHSRYDVIRDFVADAQPDRVYGRLYDSGAGYPAAKFGGGEGWIEGYRLRLRPDRAGEAKRMMTQVESGLYESVTVETQAGHKATAYEWIGSVDGLTQIAGGAWTGDESGPSE